MVILVGMGERLAERFLPIYLLALGSGVLVVGLLQALDNGLSALYSLVGGYLADHIGIKKSLGWFNLVAMVGFGLVALVPAWPAVLAGAVLFISWSAISAPATMSLIYRVLPENKRTMGVSMHSLVRRVPMALGPVVGGLLIGAYGERSGIRVAFGVACGLTVVALVLQQRLIEDDRPLGGTRERADSPRALLRLMSPELRTLLVTDVLIRFCEQIPYAFVVVWCMKTIDQPVSATQFGLLTVIEMVTAVAVYIPVAYLADRGGKKPFVLATFVFFTCFPIVLMFSTSFGALVIAFIVRGFKEFGEPTRKALILHLSPDYCRGAMFGLYYLIRDGIVTVAALGGAFLWSVSPQVNLVTAAAFGLLGTLVFARFGRESRSAEV